MLSMVLRCFILLLAREFTENSFNPFATGNLPKIAFKACRPFFGHFSGYMGQNLVYRSSTSQSYVPDAKYHLPKFGRQKVKFQFYFSLSLHSQPVARYLFALILVG